MEDHTILTVKLLVPAIVSFLIGVALTPFVTHYLYRWRAWKKRGGKGKGIGGGGTPEFDRLHREREVRVPRMGGLVVWGSVTITTLGFWAVSMWGEGELARFDFLSRSQTWLPLVALVLGGVVGLVDDVLTVLPSDGGRWWQRWAGEGLPLRIRLAIVASAGLVLGWWFWQRLGVETVSWWGGGEVWLGPLFPLFVMVLALSLYASGVIDGVDGLAGGVFASIFAAYGIIAYLNTQYDLAAFCFAVLGALLAFLWFNIPPARFYMTETGIVALTFSLTIIVLMTDVLGEGRGVLVLPIVGFPLVMTVASNLIQVAAKVMWKRKVFRIAPLHHHFEAIGWPPEKVTMRYWVLSVLSAFIGVLLALP